MILYILAKSTNATNEQLTDCMYSDLYHVPMLYIESISRKGTAATTEYLHCARTFKSYESAAKCLAMITNTTGYKVIKATTKGDTK